MKVALNLASQSNASWQRCCINATKFSKSRAEGNTATRVVSSSSSKKSKLLKKDKIQLFASSSTSARQLVECHSRNTESTISEQHRFSCPRSNMKSKISLAFLLSLTLSVSAAPLEQSIQVKFNNGVKTTEEAVISYHLSNAGLYLCDRSGFVGHCVHYATPFGQCGKLWISSD